MSSGKFFLLWYSVFCQPYKINLLNSPILASCKENSDNPDCMRNSPFTSAEGAESPTALISASDYRSCPLPAAAVGLFTNRETLGWPEGSKGSLSRGAFSCYSGRRCRVCSLKPIQLLVYFEILSVLIWFELCFISLDSPHVMLFLKL